LFVLSKRFSRSHTRIIEMASPLTYFAIAMKTIPIEVSGGVLRLPKDIHLPPGAHLAVLVLDEDETNSDLQTLADAGGAFDFLREEPELYSDADILPGRRNPRFGQQH